MKINTVANVFLILLLILFIDIFSSNYFSEILHNILYKVSIPLYNSKNTLENMFEKEYVVLNVTLFGNKQAKVHEVLSVDEKGIYVRNLNAYGIIISAVDGKFIGFVKKTGKVGYVTKWWENDFPVVIESIENVKNKNLEENQSEIDTINLKVVGYYSRYNIEIPDLVEVHNGKVYVSEYLEYGKLLKDFGIWIGEYSNGVFKLSIPQIPKYVILLEKYLTDGGN